MKRIKLLIIAILPLIFFACNQKDEINSPNNDDFNSAQFVLIDYLDVQNGVEDATLDKDLTLNDPLFSMNFMGMKGEFTPGQKALAGNGWFDKYDFGKHLGKAFRLLKLTDEQKEKVRGLMKTYNESMKELLKDFREANAEIVKKANADRKAIVDKIKSGEMTREEAKEALKTLNEKTRAAIEAKRDTIAVKDKMCAARATLFRSVNSILNETQKDQWEKMVQRLKNPC